MFTLEQLAIRINGVGYGNAQHPVLSISSVTRANSGELAYFNNSALLEDLVNTKAGIVLLEERFLNLCATNAIVVPDPLDAIKKLAPLFQPSHKQLAEIHETAFVHPSAFIGHDVYIGPHAVVNENVILEDGVHIGAHTNIESGVRLNKNSFVDTHVVLHAYTQIGESVRIGSGCIIGAIPFNFIKEHGLWQQGTILGGVLISDCVQIGSNTVIDRGGVGDTYIDKGVCVDNLVHIGHDAYVGTNTAIAGGAVIGAHVHIGSDCIIGGASCIAAFANLVDNIVITGMSTVSKSIAKAGVYSSGTLVHEHQQWRKNAARFKRLDDYIMKLSALERKITSDS